MIKVKNMIYLINSIIGIALMFGIPLIPPIEPLTKNGMPLGGIFIGLVYLWSTVDLLWPCLLGIIALAFTDYVDFYGILPAFADYTPLFMLFSMMFGGAVASCGLTAYIAHWFLSLKIINGRPDVFNFIIMLAMYIVSGFFDPLMAMLILWPTLYSIFKEAGYKPGDAYTRILIIATFMVNNWLMGLAAIMLSIGYGVIYSVNQSTALMLAPIEEQGLASSTFYLGLDIGMATGPMIGGVTAQNLAPDYFYPVLLVIVPIILIIYFIYHKKLNGALNHR